MKKIELLAPAGDMEKMKMAFLYGADAVYLGGKMFGLRASSGNFDLEELKEAVRYAHQLNKKIYVTLNIFAHHEDIAAMKNYILQLKNCKVDAVIVSDIGVFSLVRETAPDLPIHISTQANITNYKAADFFYRNGAERVILARELSLSEIQALRNHISPELEMEAFVHGAMCMAYSGRCLLSNFMTGRGANQGACAQACRWNYHLVEEKRPNEYFPIYEDERGSYIFNSKDLCMIEHLDLLYQSGVSSFKIEGRMKSAFYVATVVRAYRLAIDALLRNETYDKSALLEELTKVSHRAYTTGFYFGKADENAHLYDSNIYIRTYDFVGVVIGEEDEKVVVEQRNKFSIGDEIEVYGPSPLMHHYKIEAMWDEKGNPIDSAPHAQQKILLAFPFKVQAGSILRKKAGV